MGRHLVKSNKRVVRGAGRDAGEATTSPVVASPFFRFRYTYTEISAHGDTARVKGRHSRFEDGKLTCETFDGDLAPPVYQQIVRDAQHYFLGQTALFLKSLLSFLPFSGKQPPDRD